MSESAKLRFEFEADEKYPVYSLVENGKGIFSDPADFTPEEIADFKRVNAAFWWWQGRIMRQVDRQDYEARYGPPPELVPGACSACGGAINHPEGSL